MPAPTTSQLLAAVDRDRTVRFAKEITRLSFPDGREGPRALRMAELMAHPRLDIHVDPAVPGRPNQNSPATIRPMISSTRPAPSRRWAGSRSRAEVPMARAS